MPRSHRATMTAIGDAQSADRVAQAISEFAPHHKESDPTRTKSREGCASTYEIFTKHFARTTKDEHWKCHKRRFTFQPLFCRGLQSIACGTKNAPEASEVLHLQHGIIIMSKKKNDDNFTTRNCPPFEKSSKFCICREKGPPKPPPILICLRFSTTRMKPSRCPAPAT